MLICPTYYEYDWEMKSGALGFVASKPYDKSQIYNIMLHMLNQTYLRHADANDLYGWAMKLGFYRTRISHVLNIMQV